MATSKSKSKVTTTTKKSTSAPSPTIKSYQDAYNSAKAKNDTKGMADAHAGAESIRAKSGISGGTDGSQSIKINTSSSSKSNSSSKSASSVTNPSTYASDGKTDWEAYAKANYGEAKTAAEKADLKRYVDEMNLNGSSKVPEYGQAIRSSALEKTWQTNKDNFYNSTIRNSTNPAVKAMWDKYEKAITDAGGLNEAVMSGKLVPTAKSDYRGVSAGSDGREYAFNWLTGESTGNKNMADPKYDLLKDPKYKAYQSAYADEVFSNEFKKMVDAGQLTDDKDTRDWYNSYKAPWLAKNFPEAAKQQEVALPDGSISPAGKELTQEEADGALIKKYQGIFNDPKSTPEQKTEAHNLANAVRAKYGINGGVDGAGTVAEPLTNVAPSTVPITPVTLPEQPAPTGDSLYDKAAIKAYEAEVATLKANENTAIYEQNALIKTADKDYKDNVQDINTAEYNAMERNKITGTMRGISNSQQMQGLDLNTSYQSNGLRFKNDEDRIARVSAIKDRIAMIKENANTLIGGAESKMQANILTNQANVEKDARDKAFAVAMQQASQAFSSAENEKQRAEARVMFDKSFEKELIMAGVDQKNRKEIAAMEYGYRVSLSKMEASQRAAAARSSNPKLSILLNNAKEKLSAGVPSTETVSNSRATITEAIMGLTKKENLVQYMKTGTLPGVSAIDLKVYEDATGGKTLYGGLDYIVKNIPKSNATTPSGKTISLNNYKIDEGNLNHFLASFDESYNKNYLKVDAKVKALSDVAAMYDSEMMGSEDAINSYLQIINKNPHGSTTGGKGF